MFKNKVYAIDFEISQDGHFTFYAENEMNSTGKIFINSFAITGNTNQYKNFLNLTSDNRDSFISGILNDYSLNANSQIVKGSDVENNLRAELMNVANQYNDEKTVIENTDKNSIKAVTMFSPKKFTQQEMSELGINDLNSFAEALLNNTRGEDFDQVQGWTMDDVVATYVGEFSGEAIDYSSSVNILVITKKGIINHEVWVQRYHGATDNRFGMILSDNPNTGVRCLEEKVIFGENVVLFSNNDGNVLLNEENTAMLNDGYAYIETTGSKENPSIQF